MCVRVGVSRALIFAKSTFIIIQSNCGQSRLPHSVCTKCVERLRETVPPGTGESENKTVVLGDE